LENINKKAQIIYISHGGGPLPILGEPSHNEMVKFMKDLPSKLRKPEAIIVISAHWEENVVTIQGGNHPEMLYDYYGFPDEAYKINYPSMGSKEYTGKISGILDSHGIKHSINDDRGYDHGHFIPLMLMYPEADIPSLQISLLHNLDANDHINLGKALSKLVSENILIIGSGFSFHNLREYNLSSNIEDTRNNLFQDYLIEACTTDLEQKEREKKLIEWKNAPNARYCHPRPEHLLPLHVCVGIANDKAKLIFNNYIAGKRAVAFLWE
jgi:aromatic ring-opening dioxygenase catalytic subunit (LigB family)